MLFSGLKVLAPYAHTNCHAKYWDRWTNNDVQRSVRIMLAGRLQGDVRARVPGRSLGRGRGLPVSFQRSHGGAVGARPVI